MNDDHPGISQHGHHLANGCSLVERIDTGRPEGFDAPPQRRWRLVLDLGVDDIDDIGQVFDHIVQRIDRRSKGGTSGSPSHGYHWELIDQKPSHRARSQR